MTSNFTKNAKIFVVIVHEDRERNNRRFKVSV